MKISQFRHVCYSVLSASIATALMPARAQAQPGFSIETVIVTARRVEENLQDTPVSVTVLSGDELDERQIFSSENLAQVVPNLSFTNDTALAGNNSSSVIFIRGIGQTDPTASADPGVGLYIDDVYMGQSIGGTLDLRDIRSVQVLRGPQGTLFGRNTVGGAIVLTTNEPGDEFGGSVKLGAGSDSLLDAFVAIDAPGSERFRSRWTFGLRQQDGYVTRLQTGEDLGDTDTQTLTGKMIWDMSDRLQLRALFDYTRSDENGNPFVFAASNEDATFQKVASRDAGCPGAGFPAPPVPLIDDIRCANDFQAKGPYANNGTYDLRSDLENVGASFHVIYDINDSMTFKSITSTRSLEWRGIRDADNTPLTILHTDYDSDGDQFSQEFQWLYSGEGLTGVAGVYYFEEEIDDRVLVQLNDPAPGVQQDSDNNITDNSSWAVFTQWTFDVSDMWSLTFGGRYTEDTKGSIPDQYNYVNPDAKYLPVQLYQDKFDAFTASASIAYRWSERGMGYLSYAEGFKGGGWNSHFNTCQILEPCATDLGLVPGTPPYNNAVAASTAFATGIHSFAEEEAETIELGFKLDLLDNSLRLNGSVFTTDYTDLQFTYRAGVAPYIANAGVASIDGAELEATWVPSSNWIVVGGIGTLDTSIDSLRQISVVATGIVPGNALPFSPELEANLGIGYTGTIGNNTVIRPRIDFIHRDTTYFDANNTVEIAQLGSAQIVNMRVAIEPGGSDWSLTLGVNNATDELYATGGNSSLTTGSGYAEIAYARPREYYLSFGLDF